MRISEIKKLISPFTLQRESGKLNCALLYHVMRTTKKLLIIISIFTLNQYVIADEIYNSADNSRCLIFSRNKSVIQISLFLRKHHIHPPASYHTYSANFDLNNDGRPEYFYYLSEPGAPGCGTISLQIGCPIEIYQSDIEEKFIDISADVMHPGLDFQPEKHRGYICVSDNKTAGWHDLIEKRWWKKDHSKNIYQYNGSRYKLIRRKD